MINWLNNILYSIIVLRGVFSSDSNSRDNEIDVWGHKLPVHGDEIVITSFQIFFQFDNNRKQ